MNPHISPSVTAVDESKQQANMNECNASEMKRMNNKIIINQEQDEDIPGKQSVDLIMSKTRVVNTNEMKLKGKPWSITRIIKYLLNLDYKLIDLISKVKVLYFILFLRWAGTLTLISLGIYILTKCEEIWFVYLIMSIFIVLQLGLLASVAYSTYQTIEIGYEPPNTFGIFLIMILINTILCPVVAYIQSSELSLYSTLILLAYLIINLVYVLNFIALIIVLPFLAIIGLGDLVYHVFIGNFECPQEERIIIECTYKLYPYSEQRFQEKICPICREPFSSDQYICKLQCSPMHIFHEECIFTAIVTHPTCPICRQPVAFT